MKIEFIEVPDHGIVGSVVHTIDKRLTIDGKALLPREGEEVQLPAPYRKTRIVKAIRWRYGKHGLLGVQVLLRPKPRAVRKANGRRRQTTERKVRQMAQRGQRRSTARR